MKRCRFLLTAALSAPILVACAPTSEPVTRGFTPVDVPPTYGVEREIREGKIELPGAGEAEITKRVAVVIGNSSYANITRLDNPRNDASAMADLLRQNGFQVVQGTDIGKRSFERLLRNAVRAGGGGAEYVAFYAGHGFQVGSKNYLVPTDARIETSDDLPFNTVRLSTILRMVGNQSDRHLTFLDSCRNNPFPAKAVKDGVTRGTSGTAVGFSEPSVPRGGLVSYATRPGEVAYDGEGTANSPFTGALLRNIRENPDAPITATLRRVRSAVRSNTSGKQVPVWTSRLDSDFAFKEETEAPAPISPEVAASGTSAATTAASAPAKRPEVTPAAISAKPATVTVEAPMENVVAAGGRIAEELDLPADATVTIVAPPEKGTVAEISQTATLTNPVSKPLKVADAGAVVYVAPPEQMPVTSAASDAVITDNIVVEVKTPAVPPQRVNVTLRLKPHPCDVEAGDYMDLQGVGVYRPEGTFTPEAALGACQAAVAEDPSNPRFRYQLGKALAATGDTKGAVEALKMASAKGHLRADYALGEIAEAEPGQEAEAVNLFERCLDGGDPYCAIGLGRVYLKSPELVQREKAYDVLSYPLDLGLPEAFQLLADHFASPGTPDFDLDRATAFAREARARGAPVPPQLPRPVRPIVFPFGPPDGGEDPAPDDGLAPEPPEPPIDVSPPNGAAGPIQ